VKAGKRAAKLAEPKVVRSVHSTVARKAGRKAEKKVLQRAASWAAARGNL